MMKKNKFILPIFISLIPIFIFFTFIQDINAQSSCISGSDCSCPTNSCTGSSYSDFSWGGCTESGVENRGNGTCRTIYYCTSALYQNDTSGQPQPFCNNGVCGCQFVGNSVCQQQYPIPGGQTRYSSPYSCPLPSSNPDPSICNGDGICNNGENYLVCPSEGCPITVDPPPNRNFTLSVNPTTRSIYEGQSTDYILKITPVDTNSDAAAGMYTFGPINGCPIGATCSFEGGSTIQMFEDIRVDGTEYADPAYKRVIISSNTAPKGTYKLEFSVTQDTTAHHDITYATLYINPNPTPTVDIKGWGNTVPQSSPVDGPIDMNYNTSGGLVWTSTNATNCQIQLWMNGSLVGSGNQPVNGSAGVGPLTASQTHSIVCSNSNTGLTSNTDSFTHNVIGTMSGNLSPATETCTISAGSSSCTINFTWTTTNPISTSAVTSNTNNSGASSPNFSIATGNNSSAPTPFTVHGSPTSRNFYLYNNGTLLDQKTVSASCASGSTWDINSGTCITPPLTVSLTAFRSSINNYPTVTDNRIYWTIGGSPTSCTASGTAPSGVTTSWMSNGTTVVNNSLLTAATSDDTQYQGVYRNPGAAVDSYTYTLTCSKAGTPNVSDTITVPVSSSGVATGNLSGRVFQDTDGDFALDSGENLVRSSATPCGSTEIHLSGALINYSGTVNGSTVSGSVPLDICSGGMPAYSVDLPPTTYSVSLSGLPAGWTISAPNPASVGITSGGFFGQWFIVYPPATGQPPVVTFNINPTSNTAPNGTFATWSVTNNPDWCTADDGGTPTTWTGSVAPSGSSVPITGFQAFTIHTLFLTCGNSAGQQTKTASFTYNPAPVVNYGLNVIKSGQGTVTSSPAGISCGTDCSGDYPVNSPVVLTATPATGRIFTGWGGLCTGTPRTDNTCDVVVPTGGGDVYVYFAVDPNFKEF